MTLFTLLFAAPHPVRPTRPTPSHPRWLATRLVRTTDPGRAHAFVLGSLLLALTSLSVLQAQTIRYVKVGGTGDGSTWATSTTNLQGAIDTLAASGGGEVWVATGTYKPGGQANLDRAISFALRNGVRILGGFPATGNPGLSERNPGSLTTVLSGNISDLTTNADNAYHVVSNTGLDNTAVLDGFIIRDGNANGVESFSLQFVGGGMVNFGSSPSLTNCSFLNNSATIGGGMVNANGSSPSLTNCSFGSNLATNGGGGMSNISSSPSLINCSFGSNSATNRGGGMVNFDSSPSLTNCSFSSNSATNGGGMVNDGISSPSLTNCSFGSNSATNQGGGMANKGGSPTLINCSFGSNSATNGGGGVANFFSRPSLTNCVLFDNGGANTFRNDFFGSVTARYSLFDEAVTGYTDEGNNRTTTTSPFVSATDTQLKACSPAIDAGDNAANTTATDLAGNPRISGDRIDMGAYEFQGTPVIAITQQPASGSAVCAGATVSVSVVVSGANPTYQWYKAGTPVAGQTAATLTLPTVTSASAGSYSVVVSGCNSVTSTAFSLTVTPQSPEYKALEDLYLTTNGANWNRNSGWRTGCTPCGWQGVTCDENGRVIELRLSDNLLNGEIPASLSALINLQNLFLSGNQLTGPIPASLSALTNLQSFYLNSNQLSGSIPASLSALINLQELNLRGNQLSGPIPVSLSALTSLTFLDFGDNRLSGCFPASLSALCQRNVGFSRNPDLPGGGDFAAFCTSGAGSDAFAPTATATPNPVCTGTPVSLSVTPGTSYAWSGPAGFADTTQTPTFTPASAASSGTYSVTVGNGSATCFATATATLTVSPTPPTPTIATPDGQANPTVDLNTGPLTLLVGGCANGTVTWSGPDNSAGTGTTIAVPTTRPGTLVYQARCTRGTCTSDPATATVTVGVRLTVLHRDVDNYADNNALQPLLQLQNQGSGALPLSKLTLRYYVTVEGSAALTNLFVFFAQVGNGNVKLRYVPLAQPLAGASGYLEYGFTEGAGSLAGGANSGAIQSYAAKSDYGALNELDDYSYNPVRDQLRASLRITAYYEGADGVPVLIAGVEPGSTSPVRALRALSESKNGPSATQLSTFVEVRNEGTVAVNYSELSARYYFTADGSEPLAVEVDEGAVQTRLVKLGSPLAGADTYLELRFLQGGQLAPGTSTGTIRYRILKPGGGRFDQSNDYSYQEQPAERSQNRGLVVYVGEERVWGVEPGAGGRLASTSAEPGVGLRVRVLGNPVVGEQVTVEVGGAEGQSLRLTVTDGSGRVVSEQAVARAGAVERQTLRVGSQPPGLLLLRVSSLTQSQTVKVLKR